MDNRACKCCEALWMTSAAVNKWVEHVDDRDTRFELARTMQLCWTCLQIANDWEESVCLVSATCRSGTCHPGPVAFHGMDSNVCRYAVGSPAMKWNRAWWRWLASTGIELYDMSRNCIARCAALWVERRRHSKLAQTVATGMPAGQCRNAQKSPRRAWTNEEIPVFAK